MSDPFDRLVNDTPEVCARRAELLAEGAAQALPAWPKGEMPFSEARKRVGQGLQRKHGPDYHQKIGRKGGLVKKADRKK